MCLETCQGRLLGACCLHYVSASRDLVGREQHSCRYAGQKVDNELEKEPLECGQNIELRTAGGEGRGGEDRHLCQFGKLRTTSEFLRAACLSK